MSKEKEKEKDYSADVEKHTVKYPFKEQNNAPCPICFDEIELDEEVRRLPCLHVFHVECVDSWLIKRGFCPKCKKNLSTQSIVTDILEIDKSGKIDLKAYKRARYKKLSKNNNNNESEVINIADKDTKTDNTVIDIDDKDDGMLEEYNYLDDRDDYILERRNARTIRRKLITTNNQAKKLQPIQIDGDDKGDDSIVVVKPDTNKDSKDKRKPSRRNYNPKDGIMVE